MYCQKEITFFVDQNPKFIEDNLIELNKIFTFLPLYYWKVRRMVDKGKGIDEDA